MRLVTKSEYARIAGISPQAVTSLVRNKLGVAMRGNRINLDHPNTVQDLEKRRIDPATVSIPAPKPRGTRILDRPRTADSALFDDDLIPAPTIPGRERVPGLRKRRIPSHAEMPGEVGWAEIERYADASLRDLTRMFGTATAFGDWLTARKRISEIREKDLRNAEKDGQLISRELVTTHVFGALEGLSRRLLGDAPKTISQRLYALAKSGAPLEEAEAVVRELMSSQIRPVKDRAARTLREAGK